jgi:hypothetical protein
MVELRACYNEELGQQSAGRGVGNYRCASLGWSSGLRAIAPVHLCSRWYGRSQGCVGESKGAILGVPRVRAPLFAV